MHLNFNKTLLTAAIAFVSTAAMAEGPWVLDEDYTDISTSYISDTINAVWEMGDIKTDPHPKISQQNIWLVYSYGYSERTTVSASVGYTQSQYALSTSSSDDFSGLSDSKFSLKYQLTNEFWSDQLVTVSTKFSLLVRGTYDRASAGRPHAPGDKANGFDASIQAGKFISDSFATYFEVGARRLYNDVPNEYYYNTGFHYSMTPKLSLSGLYAGKKSTSGTDLNDPTTGFTLDGFHKLREERTWVEVSGNFLLDEISSISLGFSLVIDGKNTGQSEVIYLSYSYSY